MTTTERLRRALRESEARERRKASSRSGLRRVILASVLFWVGVVVVVLA